MHRTSSRISARESVDPGERSLRHLILSFLPASSRLGSETDPDLDSNEKLMPSSSPFCTAMPSIKYERRQLPSSQTSFQIVRADAETDALLLVVKVSLSVSPYSPCLHIG